ncbi:MAG TPA: bifunctional riboflavin kinase/FAD synthetase [Planctomycetaceae bacterium]|nr:bifunctional riboflavin kinase/FAD synthetase [Planctomycetaceae bacterium]
MQLVRGNDAAAVGRGGFVSIGNFDGVHNGHKRIAQKLVDAAVAAGVPSVVMTFDPHPIQLLRPDSAPPLLSSIEDRANWLGELGVDVLMAFSTTIEMLALKADEFFNQVVVGELAAKGMVEGPGFFFGKDRKGNVDVLASLCQAVGIELDIVEPARWDGDLVSSSRIRSSLSDGGDVASAASLLGRPYAVRGLVVAGEGRGRELGVPTANLASISTLIPADGVYVGSVVVDGRPQPAAIHVGSNPTFGEIERKVEVHLLAFDGDLYGRELVVEFLDRVRDTRTFDSVEQLQEQLSSDIEAVWRYLEAHPAATSGTGGGAREEVS